MEGELDVGQVEDGAAERPECSDDPDPVCLGGSGSDEQLHETLVHRAQRITDPRLASAAHIPGEEAHDGTVLEEQVQCRGEDGIDVGRALLLRLLEHPLASLEQRPHDLLQDVCLGVEVVVERCCGDADPQCEVPHRGAFVPLGAEHLERCAEDLTLGVAPGSLLSHRADRST